MPASPQRHHTGVDLNSSNKKTTTISHQGIGRKRRKKSKMKHNSMEVHEEERDQTKAIKRKSNDTPENDWGTLSDVLDTDQMHDLQCKMPKSNPQTWKGGSKPLGDSWDVDSGFSSEFSPSTSGRSSPCVAIDHSNIVAMDCEMVGTGPGGRCSEVARCSIVNYYGSVIYNKYILPQQRVTDYRTRWSGITKHHLANAVQFEVSQNEIINILKGKVIIGHSLHNDFKVLDISVPANMIRDTCSCHLLLKRFGPSFHCGVSLKKLSKMLLNRTIQVGKKGHCSLEDARAALDLYKLVEDQWEKDLTQDLKDHASDPNYSLEHYMQDQYWPESETD